MAKRILVPLDEAVRAEGMIEELATLSRGSGAVVRLLHVASTPDNLVDEDGRVLAYADQEAARLEAAALDYLRRIATTFGSVTVECAVRFGDPAEQILEDADAWDADLIAIATRGGAASAGYCSGAWRSRCFARRPRPSRSIAPQDGERPSEARGDNDHARTSRNRWLERRTSGCRIPQGASASSVHSRENRRRRDASLLRARRPSDPRVQTLSTR